MVPYLAYLLVTDHLPLGLIRNQNSSPHSIGPNAREQSYDYTLLRKWLKGLFSINIKSRLGLQPMFLLPSLQKSEIQGAYRG